jgi:hypothetical protein
VPYSRFVKWVQKQDPAATFESERFRSDALGIAGGSRSDKSHKFLDHLLVFPPRYYDGEKELPTVERIDLTHEPIDSTHERIDRSRARSASTKRERSTFRPGAYWRAQETRPR